MKSKLELKAIREQAFKLMQEQIEIAKARQKQPDIEVCIFGHEDENGKIVCKGLDMIQELMKKEIEK